MRLLDQFYLPLSSHRQEFFSELRVFQAFVALGFAHSTLHIGAVLLSNQERVPSPSPPKLNANCKKSHSFSQIVIMHYRLYFVPNGSDQCFFCSYYPASYFVSRCPHSFLKLVALSTSISPTFSSHIPSPPQCIPCCRSTFFFLLFSESLLDDEFEWSSVSLISLAHYMHLIDSGFRCGAVYTYTHTHCIYTFRFLFGIRDYVGGTRSTRDLALGTGALHPLTCWPWRKSPIIRSFLLSFFSCS
ncbi:hypothetical protein K435DRAFT_102311 [Dendrothele bispora CBS 962.96]|uniref:Uncharacterized protein n=1 Tax=Dendrothele bispora (strain CBS 962.96) TaxID=1314807 RepID=A0A4S8KNI8_DENBC|nr:hypothetical protein K435DRAFT_102311 [Dendrothele bispora CBS 962.96]